MIENCTLAAFVSAVVKDDDYRIVTERPNEKLVPNTRVCGPELSHTQCGGESDKRVRLR